MNVLIIGSVWPEPKSSAAGLHMMHLILALQSDKHQITFANISQRSERAVDLSQLGIAQKKISLNNSSFDEFVKSLSPDMVIFDRFMSEEQFGWRVSENCPDALRILNTEDLHGLRQGRQLAVLDDRPFERSYFFNETAKREIASIYRCDLSLIISEYEMEILRKEFNIDKVLLHYYPFALAPISDATIKEFPSFKERHHFITIGNFLHAPNYDAVLQLKEVIWPLIRKELPTTELHIYGSYMPQKAQQLHDETHGFIIKGEVEDANEVMQNAKVCLAPLRYGAGLKGKIIDAMLNGTPCVTTTIGAEGLFGDYDPNGCIEDNPQDFADKAISLFNDQELWNRKQKNGFDVINNRFDKTTHSKAFLNIIKSIKNTLREHRLRNFMGAMLQHQSLQSTKFMSKWIEEKNK